MTGTNDLQALLRACDLTNKTERRMLADAYEEAGEAVAAQMLREVSISLDCEEEYASIEGNCSAIDEETDRETEEWIRRQLAEGNEWAWCCAVVKAEWVDDSDYLYEAETSLGYCSYLSRDDFKRGGYYADMVYEVIEELLSQIRIDE